MKLTKRVIDKIALPEKGQLFHWDDDLKGFGIRVTPSGTWSAACRRTRSSG